MGKITLHSHTDKKWKEVELKPSNNKVLWYDTDITVGDPGLDLYNKYFHKKSGKIEKMSFGDAIYFYKNIFKEDLLWYERLSLRLSVNYFYLNEESVKSSIKALKLMDKYYGDNGNHYRYLADVLENYKFKEGESLAFGYSSGGFWGTEVPAFLQNIKGVNRDKLADNYHVPPHMGYNVDFDIKIPD